MKLNADQYVLSMATRDMESFASGPMNEKSITHADTGEASWPFASILLVFSVYAVKMNWNGSDSNPRLPLGVPCTQHSM